MTVVLDTCALIWWSLDPDQLSISAKAACEKMEVEKNGLVASISLWEIAIKIKNQKLDLGVSVTTYLEALQKSDVITIIPIDENLWLESVALEWSHKDPGETHLNFIDKTPFLCINEGISIYRLIDFFRVIVMV